MSLFMPYLPSLSDGEPYMLQALLKYCLFQEVLPLQEIPYLSVIEPNTSGIALTLTYIWFYLRLLKEQSVSWL